MRGIHFSAQQILPLCVPKQMVLPENTSPLCKLHQNHSTLQKVSVSNQAFYFISECIHIFPKMSETTFFCGVK